MPSEELFLDSEDDVFKSKFVEKLKPTIVGAVRQDFIECVSTGGLVNTVQLIKTGFSICRFWHLYLGMFQPFYK